MDEIDALLEEADALTRASDDEGAASSGWTRTSAAAQISAPRGGPAGQRMSVSRCVFRRVLSWEGSSAG